MISFLWCLVYVVWTPLFCLTAPLSIYTSFIFSRLLLLGAILSFQVGLCLIVKLEPILSRGERSIFFFTFYFATERVFIQQYHVCWHCICTNLGDVCYYYLNNSFQYLNNITCISTHFFTHMYFHKTITTLLEIFYQTSPQRVDCDYNWWSGF